MKTKSPTLDAISELEAQSGEINYRWDKFLIAHGWKRTSDTPNCCWYWTKKIPKHGKVMVTRETAIEFEERLCGEEYPE